MASFTTPNAAVAGDAIIASDTNANWDYVKNWVEGVPGQTATYPGVLQSTGGSVDGTLTVTGVVTTGGYTSTASLTSTGSVSLGTSDAVYLDDTMDDVIGLATGTGITGEIAGNFLFDNDYRANFTSAGPGDNTHQLSYGSDIVGGADAGTYLSEKHKYSVYSKRAGEGYVGASEGRPEAKYRLVIDGSMAIRGDIIGYTSYNESDPGTSTDYGLGKGTRINCQWLNVRANVDIGGELRVQTRYDYARIYLGNDYYVGDDYIEWKDDLDGLGNAGLAIAKDNVHLVRFMRSGNYFDMRTVITPTAGVSSYAGFPTLAGTNAVIATGTVDSVTSQQLGITSSSIRFKEDVEDLDTGDTWTKLRALKPRTFRWNEEVATNSGLDYETQTPEPGFIAEEVHEAAPDAAMYDQFGDPIVYREKSMIAMLVKAVQDIDNRLGALE